MTTPTFDPIASWQKIVQDWEIQLNNWSGKVTETEQFGALLGQATKMMVVTQKTMNDHLEGFMQSLNLPTKVQLEAMTEKLDAIEDSIAQLRIALDRLAADRAPVSASAEPRRTRTPPATKSAGG